MSFFDNAGSNLVKVLFLLSILFPFFPERCNKRLWCHNGVYNSFSENSSRQQLNLSSIFIVKANASCWYAASITRVICYFTNILNGKYKNYNKWTVADSTFRYLCIVVFRTWLILTLAKCWLRVGKGETKGKVVLWAVVDIQNWGPEAKF